MCSRRLTLPFEFTIDEDHSAVPNPKTVPRVHPDAQRRPFAPARQLPEPRDLQRGRLRSGATRRTRPRTQCPATFRPKLPLEEVQRRPRVIVHRMRSIKKPARFHARPHCPARGTNQDDVREVLPKAGEYILRIDDVQHRDHVQAAPGERARGHTKTESGALGGLARAPAALARSDGPAVCLACAAAPSRAVPADHLGLGGDEV